MGLFIASRIGGGTAAGEKSHYSNLFLTIHVGCVLAAFAGFTLAASLATLYLVEERGLNRHSPDILRLKLPSLVVLEKLTVRTIAISLPLLTIGLVAGFVRLREEGKGARRAHGRDDRRLGRLRRPRSPCARKVGAPPTSR